MDNNNIKAGVCKYPKEVYSALTSTKTFSVRGELVAADANKGQSPYKVYDGVFSRFVFTIVNKQQGKPVTFPDANIPVGEIAGLIENSKSAKNADTILTLPFINQMFSLVKESTKLTKRCGQAINTIYNFIKTGKEPIKKEEPKTNIGSKAKSVQIANGTFKGQTPFQILLKDPNNAEALNKQYAWLAQNIGKYPKNKTQMDAIQEALYMLNNGLIKEGDSLEDAPLSLGDVVLYEALPKALIRKEDKNGFCPVYEISIVWHIGDKYPAEVIIKNYKAPVQKSDKGTINPLRQQAVDVVVNNFRLSSMMWFECLNNIRVHMNRFEMVNINYQFNQAEVADRLNREASKTEYNRSGEYYNQTNQ